MSWGITLPKPVAKADLSNALDNLYADSPRLVPEMHDQFLAAKEVAILLAKSIPGPYISVSLNGHANGVGWQAKEGWADDCISVYVTQVVKPAS